MKVAVVHDWLTGMRGGEKVLEAILELYPDAPLYTLLHIKGSVSPLIENRRLFTSFIQKLPQAQTRYRYYLPLFPKAIESFDLSGYDLILSSSHCVAKGVLTRGTPHLSYIHSPMRYMWDLFEQYFSKNQVSKTTRLAAKTLRPLLQNWDKKSSARVTRFVANSSYIADRIQRCYGRESTVIHPFVDLDRFHLKINPDEMPTELKKKLPERYFLILSAFAPYKKIEVAIEAAERNNFPLVVAGDGQEKARLLSLQGKNTTFLISPPDDWIPHLYKNALALLFPGTEDFGITPLEAMASGTPVIAFARGGQLETVTPQTGVFFQNQDCHSLANAMMPVWSGKIQLDPQKCRERAAQFSKSLFKEKFLKEIELTLENPNTRK